MSETETFNAPDDVDNLSWKMSVSFLNGESQEMRGYDGLPLRINELVLELLALFEEKDNTRMILKITTNLILTTDKKQCFVS